MWQKQCCRNMQPRRCGNIGVPLQHDALLYIQLTESSYTFYSPCRYDDMMANSLKLEKLIIQQLEKFQKPLESTEKRTEA